MLAVLIGLGTERREIGGTPFELETHDEQTSMYGDLCAVEKAPRDEVHEIEIAIARGAL